MNFIIKQKGQKSDRDKSLIKKQKSPAIMASGLPTKFLPSFPEELCKRLNLLLQEEQAGNNYDKIDDEIVAIFDEIIDYNCVSKKQHKQILIKCNRLHE